MQSFKKIKIGQKYISEQDPVYFIADIAANHDGDLGRAKDLIYMAKEAGADCVKFQHFKAEKIVSDFGFKNLKTGMSHQETWSDSVFNIYKKYEYVRSWNEELVKTAKDLSVEFMTTPYDIDAVNEIDSFVNAYKIGSGDITYIDFLKYIAKLNKPLILSSGASDLSDVSRAINAIKQINEDIILLQCNTNYTASLDNFRYINLNVLNTFRKEFPGILLGLSDHTLGHSTVLGAIALGAKVIEKHFTDDNSRSGPDHKFAMTPKTWKEMIDRARELEIALGDGIKKIEDNEKETVVVQRRCIRLKRDLKEGAIITEEDIQMLRPAPKNSYVPYLLHKVVGEKIVSNIKGGDFLRKEHFK